ncbi:MBL fold metallo-hydrolase [Candidatus Parcubacteria bacterium]|nr:MBL fold metallo-hydrolase [Candidatus Parcubacteria bacterium]
MIVSYQGVESVKISQGDLTLAINPISKNSKLGSRKFGADITLITTNHPDLNGEDQTSRGDKESFVIKGPGEYEVSGVTVKGFLSESNLGGKKLNTIYTVLFEGMNLAYLGALSNPTLPTLAQESMEDIDILFVPIGDEGTLDPESAYKLAVSLEPKVIIPIHYGAVGKKDALNQFLKEGGEDKNSPLDKLVVKKRDLEGKEGEIVVLKEE